MKKIGKILIALVAVVGMTMLYSCGNKEEAAKVAEKIEAGQQLSSGDYTVIIDYLGNFAEKAQPVQDEINNLSATDPKTAELQTQLDGIRKKFNYLDLFNKVIESASQSEIGADNVALVNKYAGYEWFNAPGWATINSDPEVGGLELETPDSDSTGVVAGAVDELQVKE